MSYVQPDLIPGTTTPIYGYGVVTVDSIDILDRPDAAAKTIGQLSRGTVTAVMQVTVEGENTWARVPAGWVNLNALNMRTIYEQSVIPAAPEWPDDPKPTEPTNPTEPSTEPTEPSTEPTEPSTEPTEPTTPPTEPPTEAPTEAPTVAPTEPPVTEAPTEPAATEPAE